MKRVRCPKCDNFITFDETKYTSGQSLVFECPQCGKQFGIRIGVSKLRDRQKEENPEDVAEDKQCGSIVVIENVFHYKQIIPLRMGDNSIGRYMKGSGVTCRDKKGELKYTLRDGPSYTGTFVDNEILGDRERRIIHHGTLFTLGATSIILREAGKEDDE